MRIFIAHKNPSPRPGMNPRRLGPVASTLTTTSPRRLNTEVNLNEIMCKHKNWLKVIISGGRLYEHANEFHRRLKNS
jgi:hypothetical protein